MILDFFIQIARAIIDTLANNLPDVSLPAELSNAAIVVFDTIGSLNWLLPVDHFFIVASLILGFELTLVGIRLFLWTIHLLRGN